MLENIPNSYIYLFHLTVVGPMLMWIGWTCGHCSCKCIPKPVAFLLIFIGLLAMLYHGYKYSTASFIDSSSRLGLPLYGGQQGFADFSFPYQNNNNCYYSYHDTEHVRDCPAGQGMAVESFTETKPNTKPNNYGMTPVTPLMGRNL